MKKSIFSRRIKTVSVVLSSLLLLTACGGAAGPEAPTETAVKETVTQAPEMKPITTQAPETDPETTEVPEPVPAGKVEFYQLVPETASLMMSYLIVTPNRKIIVIDGGIDGTGIDAKPYLPSAIRAILGLGEGDYFEVEAWFLTHVHRDHYNELAKMLTEYTAGSNYKINNFYFDFPEIGVEWSSAAGESDYDIPRLNNLKKGMDIYYSVNGFNGIKGADIPEDKWAKPDGAENYYYDLINGAVINAETTDAGLTIDIDGVIFKVLMTWWPEARYVNSTSVIMRMEYGEHSVLFLADCAEDEGKRLLSKYDPEVLKAEYVQMGHHGQSGPDKAFYDAIDAANSKRLWPTPSWVWNDAKTYRIGETRSWVGLPYEATAFKKEGYGKTGNDIVAGLCTKYPASKATVVSKWSEKVLDAQRVAIFEK